MKTCQVIVQVNFALLLVNAEVRAWNILGHMLSDAIAYQNLQRENPATIPAVR